MIAETAEIYKSIVLPYILTMVGDRIQWVHNILDHKAESDRILFEDPDPENGFILLPDLYEEWLPHENDSGANSCRKWDGKTLASLYMVCIVHRRDIKSLRDLDSTHIDFLRHLKSGCTQALRNNFQVDQEQLRLYIHCTSLML